MYKLSNEWPVVLFVKSLFTPSNLTGTNTWKTKT